jgi:16S rRNA A1518/A1519 N6-dimethyltransferase RsmA/KsgA/DIM1 with predicted DNA glycosylase/AP lyase activity
VANLPFAHTTDVLRKLFDEPSSALLRADLIVQWGTAVKRCSQRPSTLLTMCWTPWWELTITRKLSPASFRPAPSCDCAVMTVTRRPDPLLDVRERDAFVRFLRTGFETRPDATELDAWDWARAFDASSRSISPRPVRGRRAPGPLERDRTSRRARRRTR